MKRAAAFLLVAGLVASAAPTVAAADDLPAGLIRGREHEVRVRRVLAELPPQRARIGRSAREQGESAVATCDPAQVVALAGDAPTTTRAGDSPTACVVVPASTGKRPDRLLLAPATFTGSELDEPRTREVRGQRERVVVPLSSRGRSRWAFYEADLATEGLALTLDARVVDVVPVVEERMVLGGRRGFIASEARRIREDLDDALLEEVIQLARDASLSRSARELFVGTRPIVREKADFANDCPLPEADDTFVLGCYDYGSNKIAILRVERPDLAGVMPVIAAHELLHAAYGRLDRPEQRKIDDMIDTYLAEHPHPDLLADISLYEGDERAEELHSVLGTEVRDLSRPLERYYARYFEDRAAVVTLYEGYERVFDDLETRFEQLDAEIEAIAEELAALDGQIEATRAEAQRLGNQILELRAQGRIAESNALVGPQNAAVARVESLVARYNALVDQHNAKVDEANAIAESLGELYDDVTPI